MKKAITLQSAILAVLAAIGLGQVKAQAAGDQEGAELIGQKAPEFQNLTWLNSPPLTIKSLRGQVVLIRFWLIDCPYCRTTAPALNYLFQKYRSRGLVVIGIHHPKSEAAHNLELVRKGAEELDFQFPLASDNQWSTVKSFWLSGHNRSYTSASFLLDKQGQICWIHPGGEIRMEYGRAKLSEFEMLEREIQKLLVEK